MTRATLLALLAHPAALRAPDVRALEELAQTFPYCQTAHLLLAKAAHDQDSMLAAQRLRRAATYAADRARLRQLIELPALETVGNPVAVEAHQPVPAIADHQPIPPYEPAPPTSSEALITHEQDTDSAHPATLEDKPNQVILPAVILPTPSVPAEAAATTTSPELPEAAGLVATETLEAPPHAATELSASEATASDALVAEAPPAIEEPAVAVDAEVPGEDESFTEEPVAPPAATGVADEAALVAESAVPRPAEAAAEAELPAQAPPIRLPAAAEAARFEFGLAASEAAELTVYRLPEVEEPGQATLPATPRLPVFSGAPDIYYSPSEGSRLGFCLMPAATDPDALPGSELPPTGEFFAPDVLLLDFLASLPPPEAPKPTSLDLINSFLQRAPLASRRRAMPSPAMPDPEAQADLSLPSTRVEFDLVSENLAAILARQGKNERAIAVYERLMAKYPEKIAYFAAQIESLRP